MYRKTVTIINNTTIINNYSGSNRNRYAYAPGPDLNDVRRVSGNQFNPVQIREASTPGERISGSQYVIYHPRVSSTGPAARGDAAGRPSTPAPARYETYNNVRPSSQYPSYNQVNNNPAPANNPRPAVQNPTNQQPNYNRPAEQNPGYNQPNNNPQPVNNPRPATQNPVNNPQPVNNPRPATQNPVNNPQPVNNPRPATQNPVNNPQPVNNPRLPTPNPVNNPTPAVLNSIPNQQPAPSNQPAGNHMNDVRMNQLNQAHNNARLAQTPAQNNLPKPSPVNHVQTTGRPATVHNPNNGQPVQRTAKPENQQEQRSTEKPKTREANNN